MKIKKGIALILILVLITGVLAACGGGDEADEVVIMEGMFSEVTILAHMTGILIEEHTDLNVTYQEPMSTVPFANALEAEELDMGLSYDGTLLTTLLGYDPSDVPEGEDLYDFANEKGMEDRGFMLLGNLGFENTYAIGVKRDFAEEHNLETVSDLVPIADELTFGAEHEFFDEEGTMRFNPFNEHYGLTWADDISMDMAYKYTAMDNENIDVTMVYTTDGLNVQSDIVMLEDDLDFFPQYYASMLVRDNFFEEYEEVAPELEEVVGQLDGMIDNEAMTQMNYEVDAEGREAEEVAREFLVENNLIDG